MISRIVQAYERSKLGRNALRKAGARSMEVTEDKAGIVWERFVIGPKGTSVILFATPSWWEIFTPLTEDRSNDGTINAINELAK